MKIPGGLADERSLTVAEKTRQYSDFRLLTMLFDQGRRRYGVRQQEWRANGTSVLRVSDLNPSPSLARPVVAFQIFSNHCE